MNIRLFNTLIAVAAALAIVWLLMAYEYERGHELGVEDGKATCNVALVT
jgi:hypothetical protein